MGASSSAEQPLYKEVIVKLFVCSSLLQVDTRRGVLDLFARGLPVFSNPDDILMNGCMILEILGLPVFLLTSLLFSPRLVNSLVS